MKPSSNFRFEDFIVDAPIGQGAFGQIYKATHVVTGEEYALKALNRRFLIKMKKQNQPLVEKKAQMLSQGPFVAKLFGTFKDDSSLYFIFELCNHGDLAEAVSNLGSLNVDVVRLLAAQLLVALTNVHSHNIIHRDVKPENILLDDNNHVKLTDFGTALIGTNPMDGELVRSSIVGTPAFVAPELLTDGKICFSSDLWSFGCVIFNLLTGRLPFEGSNPAETMASISSLKFSGAIDKLPQSARDLVKKLIAIEPSSRLGHGEHLSGYKSIRSHPFFKGIDWNSLENVEMPVFTPFTSGLNESSMANGLLEADERVILEGKVDRRRIFSWKERDLVLTSHKRLFIFNCENRQLKQSIPLTTSTKAALSSNGKEWTLVYGSGKSQTFRSHDGMGSMWASSIVKTAICP